MQAYVQNEDISVAEETPNVQPDVQFEDILKPGDTPSSFDVDGILFEFQDGWPPYGFEEGQSTSYRVNQAGQPPAVQLDQPSGSWALWYQYVYACE